MPCESQQINVLKEIGAVARTTLKSKRRAEDWTSWRSPKPSCTTRRGSTGKGAPTGTSPSGAAGQPFAREPNVMMERAVITATPEAERSLQEWRLVFFLARRGWRKRENKQQYSMSLPRSPMWWSRAKRETQRYVSKHLGNLQPLFCTDQRVFRGQEDSDVEVFRISAADERKTSRPRIHVARRALPIIPPAFRPTSKLACWNAQRTLSQPGSTSTWQRPTSRIAKHRWNLTQLPHSRPSWQQHHQL